MSETGLVVEEREYVGVGLRFVAQIIDAIVFFAIGYVVAFMTGNITETGYHIEGGPAFMLFALGFLYFWLLEAFLGGTLGKLILGMRVQMYDGSAIGLVPSLIRNILRIVDGLFIYLVAAILVWSSPTRQRLGDRVAQTVVVKNS